MKRQREEQRRIGLMSPLRNHGSNDVRRVHARVVDHIVHDHRNRITIAPRPGCTSTPRPRRTAVATESRPATGPPEVLAEVRVDRDGETARDLHRPASLTSIGILRLVASFTKLNPWTQSSHGAPTLSR